MKIMRNRLKSFGFVSLATLGFMLGGCAAKHLPMPEPVVGVDIVELTNGQAAPFNGTEFSPSYLNEYLQWKAN